MTLKAFFVYCEIKEEISFSVCTECCVHFSALSLYIIYKFVYIAKGKRLETDLRVVGYPRTQTAA